MKQLLSLLLCVVLLAAMAGCTCQPSAPEPVVKAAAPAPKPAAKPAVQPAPKPIAKKGDCGNYTVSQMFLSSNAIRIDKVMPESVQLNAPFEYVIKVTNVTDATLTQVVVKDRLSEGLKYVSSTPAAKVEGNVLTWSMDTLGPKAVERIVVKGQPTKVGCVQTCADATYVLLACAKTQVVQPALAITKTAPASVLLCDPIPLKFVVTNKGTGVAKNVKMTDRLPAGLTTQDGKSAINIALGDLAPGQAAQRSVIVKASKTGTYKNQASAMADGNLKAQSEVTTTAVTQPVLAIKKTGQKKQYLGRGLSYDITVTNTGDAVAMNTVVTDSIPAGVKNVVASNNGTVAAGVATWKLGNLAPKASKTVSISYTPSAGGSFKNTAKATAGCAKAVSASTGTNVEGIPAVLLEVIDVSDPIEVGKNETYIITVTNQGSAPDTNLVVKGMLEDTMSYVTSSGATGGSYADGTVTFAPLRSLAPKAKATWRVVVKAEKAGDVRFKVTLNTDELGREVMETEATHLYE